MRGDELESIGGYHETGDDYGQRGWVGLLGPARERTKLKRSL